MTRLLGVFQAGCSHAVRDRHVSRERLEMTLTSDTTSDQDDSTDPRGKSSKQVRHSRPSACASSGLPLSRVSMEYLPIIIADPKAKERQTKCGRFLWQQSRKVTFKWSWRAQWRMEIAKPPGTLGKLLNASAASHIGVSISAGLNCNSGLAQDRVHFGPA